MSTSFMIEYELVDNFESHIRLRFIFTQHRFSIYENKRGYMAIL